MSERAVEATALFTEVQPALSRPVLRRSTNTSYNPLPAPSTQRLEATLTEQSLDVSQFLRNASEQEGTVLYLAYGSNLSVEKFRGDRGIQPLAQINVQVPTLRMTFDLPGVPYIEPCFANSARRQPDSRRRTSEKNDLFLNDKPRYHKDRWRKGLVGVVYEVTKKDYAHIIATEGGGSGYQDIVVQCFPFATADPQDLVPDIPITQAFLAHTLFAPAITDSCLRHSEGGMSQRPDPSYAQPSARYLKLITDGATELRLPYEYQDYLHSIRSYTITTWRQRMGATIFMSTWGALMLFVLKTSKLFVDKKGILPHWMAALVTALFRAVWISYDNAFKPIFGDGERTIGT